MLKSRIVVDRLQVVAIYGPLSYCWGRKLNP
jgi:hypothetical protein